MFVCIFFVIFIKDLMIDIRLESVKYNKKIKKFNIFVSWVKINGCIIY